MMIEINHPGYEPIRRPIYHKGDSYHFNNVNISLIKNRYDITANIFYRDYNNKEHPVPYAQIRLPGIKDESNIRDTTTTKKETKEIQGQTNVHGNIRLKSLSPGYKVIEIRKEGFVSKFATLTVQKEEEGRTNHVFRFQIDPLPPPDSIQIIGKIEDKEYKKDKYFDTIEVIFRMPNMDTSIMVKTGEKFYFT